MTQQATIRLEERHLNESKSMLPQSVIVCRCSPHYSCSGGLKTKDAQQRRAQSQQLVFKYLSVELIKTRPILTSPIVEKWTPAQVEKERGPIGNDATMCQSNSSNSATFLFHKHASAEGFLVAFGYKRETKYNFVDFAFT